MATRLIDAIKIKGTHGVGNLNSLKVKTIPYGAVVTDASVDNFTLVEVTFTDGERTCKQLAAKANKAYLIATPEFLPMGEELVDFYNAVGERARIVILEPSYTRFDTSSYSLNSGVTSISAGQVAHFDPTSKKFIISTAGSAHTDYAGSSAQFLVVGNEDDLEYVAGQPTVRLEVTKA